jgi:hypothetical protein
MTDILDLEADAAQPIASVETLADISKLAIVQVGLEAAVAQKERELAELKAKLREVRERMLPDALAAANTRLHVTLDGIKVEIDEDLKMSIPEKNKPACASWLQAHGLGALVVPTVVVPLRKGQDNEAAMIAEWLDAQGFSYSVREDVNTASVKAAFRRRLEQGEPVDLDLFGGFQLRQSKITLPK